MSASVHRIDLDEVLTTSESMVEDAREGRWDNVARAEEKRRALLNRLFSNPVEIAGVPEINGIIEKIIFINKRLERLAIESREQTRMEMDKIRTGRKAVNSYSQHI